MTTAAVCRALLLVLSYHCSTTLAQTGFKTRITSGGLNYANGVALDLLSESVRNVRLPDYSGQAGRVNFHLTGLEVDRFTRPRSAITFLPSQGLHWSIDNANVYLEGRWRYELGILFLTIRDSGSFDVSVRGLSFSVGLTIGMDENGRPEIRSNQCNIYISSVRVDLSGGLSWIYNIFRGAMQNAVRRALIGQLCNVVTNLINVDGANALSRLQVTVPLVEKFALDYRLDRPPVFRRRFMETFHKGEIFWSADGTDPPFSPSPLPPWNNRSRMMYLWASDFMLNSLLYQAQEHDFLKFNLTAQSLPSAIRSVLNTSCDEASVCIGTLISDLGTTYPNHNVELHMRTTSAPRVQVGRGAINGTIGGVIDFYARPVTDVDAPNSTDVNLAYLFSLSVSMTGGIEVEMRNDTVYGQLQDVDFNIDLLDSTINGINDDALQYIVDVAVHSFVTPSIDEFLAKGIAPPSIGNVHFIDPDIQLLERTLLIGVDLQYVRESAK